MEEWRPNGSGLQRGEGGLWDEVVVCIVLGSHQIWEITIQPTVFLTATKPSPSSACLHLAFSCHGDWSLCCRWWPTVLQIYIMNVGSFFAGYIVYHAVLVCSWLFTNWTPVSLMIWLIFSHYCWESSVSKMTEICTKIQANTTFFILFLIKTAAQLYTFKIKFQIHCRMEKKLNYSFVSTVCRSRCV